MKITNSTNNVKTNRLTNLERSKIVLPNNKASILIGLLVGDSSARKRSKNSNVVIRFGQGLVHQDYLMHLFEIFKDYCQSVPKITPKGLLAPDWRSGNGQSGPSANPRPDKRTGKSYPTIRFETCSLPCFKPFYELFYVNGVKVVPQNIGELLTPLGLAYWISDDGSFVKSQGAINLSTEGFTHAEVMLLVSVLNNKWNLNCTINKDGEGFRIRIPKKSVPIVQALLKNIMPPMMLYKIGL